MDAGRDQNGDTLRAEASAEGRSPGAAALALLLLGSTARGRAHLSAAPSPERRLHLDGHYMN